MRKDTEVVDYDYKSEKLEERKNRIGVGKVFDNEYFLKDKPIWLAEAFEKIDGYCMGVQAGVKQAFLQTYCRYTHRSKMFAKVSASRESLRLYLRLDFSKLSQKPVFIRDYSQVANQKNWIELSYTEPDLLKNETIIFDVTKELIKQSFHRVLKNPQLSKIPSFGKRAEPEFVNSTKTKINLELGSDGFADVRLRCHKSELPNLLKKLIQ